MKTIYKYTLDLKDKQQIELPLDAEILSVQKQDVNICLWAKVTNTFPKKKVDIYIYGTGTEINEDNLDYTGTVQDGIYIWHVFTKK